MEWLHFLNLQYWYCVVYSLFAGECTYLDELREARGDTSDSLTFFEQLVHFYTETLSPFLVLVWQLLSTAASFLWGIFSAFAYFLSSVFFALILLAFFGLLWIRFRELYTYSTLPPEEMGDTSRREAWLALLEQAKSTNPKEWRGAILSADIMLGELLGELGYEGLTTAEKMKTLPEDAFVTVPVAWEAHRIRNFVSSGSSDFVLTQREAFRIMKLYEQVFEEFDFI